MDTEPTAAIRALARLDRDAALARLEVAAGGGKENAAAIMRGGEGFTASGDYPGGG